MQITYASVPTPQGPNEDGFCGGDNWAVVIDGAGRYPGRSGGCIHPVAWVVGRLSNNLEHRLNAEPKTDLQTVVRDAIEATMADHGASCDLDDPLSPGAALAIVRASEEDVEWFVLADCAVAIDRYVGGPMVVIDNRVDRLPNAPVVDTAVRTYDPDFVATVRNRPGGFWVAGASPDAAEYGLVGKLSHDDVRSILLCTDGVTRLTERHGWAWQDMFALASESGPNALIEAVRQADEGDPDPRRWRGKKHDDATVALIRMNSEPDGIGE